MTVRRLRRIAGIAFGALWLLVGAAAGAHTRSESYMAVDSAGDTVRVAVTLPKVEAERLAPEGTGFPSNERIADYFAQRVSATAEEKDCRPSAPARVTAAGELRRVELAFRCPGDRKLYLDFAFSTS